MGNPTSPEREKHVERRRITYGAAAFCCLLGVLAIALPASGAPPSVSEKQRQADAILTEINSLDSDLNRTVEAYNGARLHLAQTNQAIRTNTHVLGIVKQNLKQSQKNIAARLVSLYTEQDQASTIEIILGAKTLDEVVANIDAASRVTAQDARIAREATTFRSSVIARQRTLVKDRKRAAELLREAELRRSAIESSINRRQQLLASVKDDIARLQEAEHQRQLQTAAQVRARLAEEAQNAATTATQQAPSSTIVGSASQPATTEGPTGSTPAAASIGAAPPARYGGVVGIAMRYLGVPYKWGGASPSGGFDCSGFTMYVYAQMGVSLPHYTGDQWQMGAPVSRGDLQPGDLVFFDGLGHEGLYIGNNQFIHAPHTGDVVKISPMSGWYASSYMGARRL